MGARKIKVATTVTEYPRDQIPLKDLRVDPDKFQTRVKTDMETVSKYAARYVDGSPFPDVLVFLIAGVYWLVDGFHRVAAAERLGLKTITARIREATPDELLGADEQGFLAGLALNLAEITAKGYGTDDRKHAVEMMIRNEEFRTWSDKEIGRRCGISPPVIVRIRIVLRDREDIPIPEKIKKFSSDGKWTGRWVAYHRAGTTGKPAIVRGNGKGGFRISSGGVQHWLGVDEHVAVARRDDIVARVNATKASLANNKDFAVWLALRGIGANCGDPGSDIGFLAVSGTRIVPVPDAGLDSLLKASGKFHDLRNTDPDVPVILCGYFGSLSPKAARLAARMRSYRDPVPMLSPEDVVERFAPRPDAPGWEGER